MIFPGWLWNLPLDLIYDAATKHKLNPFLVAAVVQTESSGRVCATKYESAVTYTTRVNEWAYELGIEPNTELIHQKTAWGLMQIVGATARDMGFKEDLPSLCKPKLNLDLGCRYLKSKAQFLTNPADIYASYNAGSIRKTSGGMYINQRQVNRFMQFYRQIEQFKIE